MRKGPFSFGGTELVSRAREGFDRARTPEQQAQHAGALAAVDEIATIADPRAQVALVDLAATAPSAAVREYSMLKIDRMLKNSLSSTT